MEAAQIPRKDRPAVAWYKGIIRALDAERAAGGGTMLEAQEVSYARRLGAAWLRLTVEEQGRVLGEVYG